MKCCRFLWQNNCSYFIHCPIYLCLSESISVPLVMFHRLASQILNTFNKNHVCCPMTSCVCLYALPNQEARAKIKLLPWKTYILFILRLFRGLSPLKLDFRRLLIPKLDFSVWNYALDAIALVDPRFNRKLEIIDFCLPIHIVFV